MKTNLFDLQFAGDAVSSGANIRVKVGKPTLTTVDGVESSTLFKDVTLSRITVLRRSDGMPTVTLHLSSHKEVIRMEMDGKLRKLPQYSIDHFATWRKNWIHSISGEMQNPDMETVEELCEFFDSMGAVDFHRQLRSGTAPYERVSETIYDREIQGGTPMERHEESPQIASFTIIPGERHDANMVSFTRRDEDNLTVREGFTSFLDSAIKNLTDYRVAYDGGDKSKLNEALIALGSITGSMVDGETGRRFNFRPTIGYLALKPVSNDKSTIAGGKELNLFKKTGSTPTASAISTPVKEITPEQVW